MPLEIWWAVLLTGFGVIILTILKRLNILEDILGSISFTEYQNDIQVDENKNNTKEEVKNSPDNSENPEIESLTIEDIESSLTNLGIYCMGVRQIAKSQGVNACKKLCIVHQYYNKCKLNTLNIDIQFEDKEE